ncbi:hypothetical protein RND71_041132 [Anisodus tanguticus]|uniref:Uncharacterized protein n=1 Tax=Anisodus tanguticus TaxID=243964 RepID=A0AAE1UWE6_9SOLA|nr:hypothetical protein RND71_041132 [Anisodus tanguticus]
MKILKKRGGQRLPFHGQDTNQCLSRISSPKAALIQEEKKQLQFAKNNIDLATKKIQLRISKKQQRFSKNSFRSAKNSSDQQKQQFSKKSTTQLLPLVQPPCSSISKSAAKKIKSLLKLRSSASPPTSTSLSCKLSRGTSTPVLLQIHRSQNSKLSNGRSVSEENELIWWPPAPVMELARLAVDSGGDTASIQRTLNPTPIPVPDNEGSKEDRCELTRTPYGRLFINEEINSYLESLFEMIVARGPSVGLNVSLSRFDFFHGHVFLARDSGRLGILFHAKEYPAYDKEVFPCNMGYCQIGSNVSYDDSMNLRNILWLAPLASSSTKEWLASGVLVVLDAHPTGVIYKDLIPEYVQIARTLYEDDFGDVAFDVNYLNTGGETPICEGAIFMAEYPLLVIL